MIRITPFPRPHVQQGWSLVAALVVLLALTVAIIAVAVVVTAMRGFPHDPARYFPWPVTDWHEAAASHRVLPDGRIHMEIEHQPLEGISPEMLRWWYQVLPVSTVKVNGVDYPLYHLFHLTEHGQIWVEKAAADASPGMGVGAIVARQEWFGRYDSGGQARIVDFSADGITFRPLFAGLEFGEIRHSFEATPTGSRYRLDSRIGVQWPVVGRWVNALLRRYVFPDGMLIEWQRHQVEEVGMLRYFLPQLFAQRNQGHRYRLKIDERPDMRSSQWPTAGGDHGGQHHSTAAQITPANVSLLDVAWVHRSGGTGAEASSMDNISGQATPILLPQRAGGHLVYCTPFNRVIALDPGSGQVRWEFDPQVSRDSKRPYRCRGVAYWRVPGADKSAQCAHRVYGVTADRRLFAIDARNGRPCGDFGSSGTVLLPENGIYSMEEVGSSSPPVVANGIVAVGSTVVDFAFAEAPRGLVTAYDAITGARRWSFDPLAGIEGTGAANVWAPISVDVERELLFVPTSSPSPDYYGALRPGDNGYANSVVALRLASGEVEWSFQMTHHDLWDYDAPAQPVLFDWPNADGAVIPALVQVTKQGFVFVLDRETGRPLFPVEERRVPASRIEGEKASPTQPFPLKPPPLLHTALAPEDAWGLTPWDRGKCADEIASLVNEGLFTPLAEEPTLLFPGSLGGANWGGGAYQPSRHLLIVNVNTIPFVGQLVRSQSSRTLQDHAAVGGDTTSVTMQGTPYTVALGGLLSPLGIPCSKPPWGKLVALDLRHGTIEWESPLGSIHEMGPVNLPFRINWGTPNLGGGLITDGGLFFIGATMDRLIRAYDASDGSEVWHHQLPVDATATPMSYVHEGRQYIVINAGGHAMFSRGTGDYLYAFALPEEAL